LSPHQLFTAGALRLQRRGLDALDFFDAVGDMYGAYKELVKQDEYTVHVPPTRFQISDDDLSQLFRTAEQLAQSSNFGIELYPQTVTFLRQIPHS
jgi:hypothetical protein